MTTVQDIIDKIDSDQYDPDQIEAEGGTDNPLADYWATLALELAEAVKAEQIYPFTCAECGTVDAESYVVTGEVDDREGRTEVCLPCHDVLVFGPFEDDMDHPGYTVEYGRCDTCGAPCDPEGCTRSRSHDAAKEA
jgi:hypothetical protein